MWWVIMAGIEGNLAALERVLRDVYKQKLPVEEIYILGDVIGIGGDNEGVVERICNPPATELIPHVCRGWWEEQVLTVHGLYGSVAPIELIEQFGPQASRQLGEGVSEKLVWWIQSLHFGFLEFDCLLVHGSSVSVSECLSPETSPWVILDRFQRVGARYLFSARSHSLFHCIIEEGMVESQVETVEGRRINQVKQAETKHLIGVGRVNGKDGSSYVLYNPYTGEIRLRRMD